MMRITREELSEVLNVAHWYDTYFSCWCPFDVHAKPALLVYDDGAYCLSCQKSFSLDFLQKTALKANKRPLRNHNIDTHNQIRARAYPAWNLWKYQYDGWDGFVSYAIENAKASLHLEKYVQNRCISMSLIERAKIGFVDGWIVFPCYNEQGTLVDITVRNINEKIYLVRPREKDEKGTHLFVPDWELIQKNNTVLLPFGIFDCLSLVEAGLPAMTGISGKQVPVQELPATRKIKIIPDYNEHDAGIKLLRQLSWRGQLFIVDWGKYPNCKDINDIHKHFGIDEIKRLIQL